MKSKHPKAQDVRGEMCAREQNQLVPIDNGIGG